MKYIPLKYILHLYYPPIYSVLLLIRIFFGYNVISFYVDILTFFSCFPLFLFNLLLLFFFYLNFFFVFRDVPECSGMFRDVPECSGMFHVPGFIDGRQPISLFIRTFETN